MFRGKLGRNWSRRRQVLETLELEVFFLFARFRREYEATDGFEEDVQKLEQGGQLSQPKS